MEEQPPLSESVSGSTENDPLTLEGRAYAVAFAIAEATNVRSDLALLRPAPPAWVFRDQAHSRYTPTVAIRLATSDNTEALLAKTSRDVALLQDARQHSAQVQNFLNMPVERDGFVATISEYLPGLVTDSGLYGKALATLHNAGTHMDLHGHIAPFEPLARTHQTYEYLKNLDLRDRTFQVKNSLFPRKLLPTLESALAEGNTNVEQLLDMTRQRNYPLTILQQDVHMGNVRADHTGKPTLIDLDDIAIGPAEYDLTRPIGQWTQHFQRPTEQVQKFLSGYSQMAERMPDSDILQVALKVSNVRYSTSLITLAVEGAQAGLEPDEWLLYEGVRRLENLHNPNFAWESREDYLRKKHD